MSVEELEEISENLSQLIAADEETAGRQNFDTPEAKNKKRVKPPKVKKTGSFFQDSAPEQEASTSSPPDGGEEEEHEKGDEEEEEEEESEDGKGKQGKTLGPRRSSLNLSHTAVDRLRQRAIEAMARTKSKVQIERKLSRQPSRVENRYLGKEADEDTVSEALKNSWRIINEFHTKPKQTEPKVAAARMLSMEEQFDFFTGNFEREKREESEEEEEEKEERMTFMAGPTVPPVFQQLARESQLYFTPSLVSVPIDAKVSGPPRRAVEEGLYWGGAPELAERNRNALEQRLLKDPKGKDWFEADGSVKTCFNGLAKLPLRLELEDGSHLTRFVLKQRGEGEKKEGVGRLDLDLGSLLFSHHPLFSSQHVLGHRLNQLSESLIARREEQLAGYYHLQLRAHRELLEKHADENGERKLKLLMETRNLRQLRNNEEALDQKVMEQLLEVWNSLQELRTSEGYSSVSEHLVLRKERGSESDEGEWERDLMEELEELDMITQIRREQFNRDEEYGRIVDNALDARRNPGQPIYTPILTKTGTITSKADCPGSEQMRRDALERRRIEICVSLDGTEVLKTQRLPLNPDFSAAFTQIHSIHVHDPPEKLELKVLECEDARGRLSEVAVVGLPVPPPTHLSLPTQPHPHQIQFSSPITSPPYGTGVGSGEPVGFRVPNTNVMIPRTSGVIQCCTGWGRGTDGTPLVPESIAILNGEKKNDLSSMANNQQGQSDPEVDPNDPENQETQLSFQGFDRDPSHTQDQRSLQGVFRLYPEECCLISEEEFYANERFRLLEYRREKIPEFRSLRMVPPFAAEIPSDIFADYEKRLERENEGTRVIDMDTRRAAGNRYLSMVRAEVVQRLYSAQLAKAYEDVVNENPIPTCRGFACGGEDPGRPLKPVRKELSRVAVQNVSAGQVKILINILSGANVPVRAERHGSAPDAPAVEPFVEVSFQGVTAKTSVVKGHSPVWQQQLLLELTPPNNDFTPGNLQTMTDVIFINLFDQLVSDLPKDGREREHTVHQQVEKKWLGSLQIPFATLYHNGKIDGTFRLKVPAAFLGYKWSKEGEGAELIHPYLKLLAAIKPPLQTPDSIQGKFESIESDELGAYGKRWQDELQLRFPERRFVPLVLDMNGRTVLIPRYLRPIPPPQEVLDIRSDLRKAADLACRIVSIIPFISDPVLFPGMCDIWSTCDQFLNMLCGDEEEHAILLWCWLAGLGLDCLLLIGSGLPEGPRSAYVLVYIPGSIPVLYNPAEGAIYSLNDIYCPLVSVGCVVKSDNLWANIQQNEHPSTISFDLSMQSNWKPFFNRAYPNPGLGSIQVETLDYAPTDAGAVAELEANLDRMIRTEFEKWRPSFPRWNWGVGATLKSLLPELEAGRLDSEEHERRLAEWTETYKISGFPLHMGYESMDKVLTAVRSTNIHLNFNKDVEFAVGVHVHAYTNNILSVWVYIASLVRRR